jgi:rare lipoprotein A
MRRLLLVLLVCACAHNVRQEPSPVQPAPPPPTPPERQVPEREPLGEGMASYYGASLRGHLTASGERFDPRKLTAAHRTLPFQTCLVVENLGNGRRVQVRVNDRGPYAHGRIIDVSEAAARALAMIEQGIARVRIWPCA